mgnify:CR=1 FL=1
MKTVRKIETNKPITTNKQKFRVVAYCRVSTDNDDQLESLETQKAHYESWIKLHSEWEYAGLYYDSGITGTKSDVREGLQNLLQACRLGRIDRILVKSISRFSRNTIDCLSIVRELLEIGVTISFEKENIDTGSMESELILSILSSMAEDESASISQNEKWSIKRKFQSGTYKMSYVPYGYMRDSEDHNHLIIDEYAASIVRKIFRLYLEGNGKAHIASILSSENILIPSLYKTRVLQQNYYNSKLKDTTKTWCYQTVHMILNNQTYLGKMVQHKDIKISYKDKKKRRLPKEQWIVVDNTHEPIIDQETFDRVQAIQKIKRKSVNTEYSDNIFAGILFCADCKHAMNRAYAKENKKGSIGYICKIYKTMGKKHCPSHMIKNEELEEAVLSSIKNEARKILTEDDISDLDKVQKIDSREQFYKKQIQIVDAELEKYQKFKKRAFTGYMEEMITPQEYRSYVTEYVQIRKAERRNSYKVSG